MGWEPHQLIKLTPKCLIMSFGKLKEYCKSLPMWGELKMQSPKKASIQWREEQFAQAMHKRNAAKAAWEALCQQVCQQQEERWQQEDCGATLPVFETGTQMSIPL